MPTDKLNVDLKENVDLSILNHFFVIYTQNNKDFFIIQVIIKVFNLVFKKINIFWAVPKGSGAKKRKIKYVFT